MLRRPPKHLRANSNETMRREARVLAALAGTDVRHPALIAACRREDVIGAAFYLMEPVEGFTPARRDAGAARGRSGHPPPRWAWRWSTPSPRWPRSTVRARAACRASAGSDGFLERQVGRWRAQLESYAEHPGWPGLAGMPGVDEIGRWLDEHRPPSFVPGMIHGDFHFGNVLFGRDGPQMAAMVDWELTTLGDPMVDLGRLLSSWPRGRRRDRPGTPWNGFPTRAEIIARYADTAPARDVSQADWYEVLACYKIGGILEGTYARACAGRAPKETGDYLHNNTLGLFRRALEKIGG